MAAAVSAAYVQIRNLPARRALPPASLPIDYRPVKLAEVAGPLRLAGAWEMRLADPRLGGMSALAIDHGRLLSASDRGAVVRFDRPGRPKPQASVIDIREGPGPWSRKWARDAESIAEDPQGQGWWIGFEQNHSLWLYDHGFTRALSTIELNRPDWWNNRGAEGLLAEADGLLVTAENGREAMLASSDGVRRVVLKTGTDVAEASRSPDGRAWLLLRSKSLVGIEQSIAPLIRTITGYRAGPAMRVPKGAFDNYEGMAIEQGPGGGLRFWLISDDGHRIMARTLLVALDYVPLARNDESPASAGLSRKPKRKNS